MILSLEYAIAGILITAGLAAVAIGAGAFTALAGIVAAFFGSIIVVLGGFAFLALLVLFVVASVLATRYGFEEKIRRNVQEGSHGERGVSNVLAHILVPTALVVTATGFPMVISSAQLTLLYTSALAFGAADTFASEFGVLSGRARSILSFKLVTPGTNGGVSGLGEAWALVGALTTAVVGFGVFFALAVPTIAAGAFVAAATLAGFLACQVDSVLGEKFENQGRLTKGGTNLLAMISSLAFAGVLGYLFVGLV